LTSSDSFSTQTFPYLANLMLASECEDFSKGKFSSGCKVQK